MFSVSLKEWQMLSVINHPPFKENYPHRLSKIRQANAAQSKWQFRFAMLASNLFLLLSSLLTKLSRNTSESLDFPAESISCCHLAARAGSGRFINATGATKTNCLLPALGPSLHEYTNNEETCSQCH